MKKACWLVIVLFVSLCGSAQQSPDNSQIQTTLKVRALMEKKSEYHRKTNGEYEGYRVKIHFGIDRAAAGAVKSKFVSKFNDIPAYEDYLQPNFVITVGDYKTKLEAFEAMKRIQGEFPNAFIVKTKIRPMK